MCYWINFSLGMFRKCVLKLGSRIHFSSLENSLNQQTKSRLGLLEPPQGFGPICGKGTPVLFLLLVSYHDVSILSGLFVHDRIINEVESHRVSLVLPHIRPAARNFETRMRFPRAGTLMCFICTLLSRLNLNGPSSDDCLQ